MLDPDRFQRFSTLISLLCAVAFLIHMARSHKHSNKNSRCSGWHICRLPRTVDEMDQAKDVILKAAQRPAFAKELSAIQANKVVPTYSPLHKLSPTLEGNLICVGGRLKHSQLTCEEKNPVILASSFIMQYVCIYRSFFYFVFLLTTVFTAVK